MIVALPVSGAHINFYAQAIPVDAMMLKMLPALAKVPLNPPPASSSNAWKFSAATTSGTQRMFKDSMFKGTPQRQVSSGYSFTEIINVAQRSGPCADQVEYSIPRGHLLIYSARYQNLMVSQWFSWSWLHLHSVPELVIAMHSIT